MVNQEVKAWLIEETDQHGKVVWRITSFFEPDSVQWTKDIKGKNRLTREDKIRLEPTRALQPVEHICSTRGHRVEEGRLTVH